jgi:hypothetical protein
MITFFTTLEQFLYREKNSLLSWAKLDCVSQIVVYTSLDASTFWQNPKVSVRRYPKDLEPLDPPSIKDLFLDAIEKTDDKYLCYVNSDIIFLSDFCNTFADIKQRYQSQPFQMVGRRRDWVDYCDLDINNLSDEQIMEIAGDLPLRNTEHCDYFCFHKDVYLNLNSKNFFPNFLIARGSFDRCMLWLPRQIGYDSIDCSENIYALHHQELSETRKVYIDERSNLWPQVRQNEQLLAEAYRKFGRPVTVLPDYNGPNVKYNKD